METDAKIIEHLTAQGLLFKQEKIKHSYPALLALRYAAFELGLELLVR